jgi:hypothetical protein
MSGGMRVAGAALALLVLTGCASGRPVITPSESGGLKADGVVSMSSTVSLFHPFKPDWRVAQTGAAKRCRSWGFTGAKSFTGSRELCTAWDRHGRCMESQLTRYYECEG